MEDRLSTYKYFRWMQISFVLGWNRQYVFNVESMEMFEEWDSFLESQVSRAKQTVSKRTRFEKAKVCSNLVFGSVYEECN